MISLRPTIFIFKSYFSIVYSRGGQLDQFREQHFRRQFSARAMSYFILSASVLSVTMLSKIVNTTVKIKDSKQSGTKCLYLWREIR
jgi:hypothetical protein